MGYEWHRAPGLAFDGAGQCADHPVDAALADARRAAGRSPAAGAAAAAGRLGRPLRQFPPGAAINIGGIRAALASYGCAVADVALDPEYGQDAYLRRADMPGPAVLVQDHAQTLAVQCTETFYGLAGYADQDPKPGEAATTWLFNQHTDAPQAWIPAPDPDAWQVYNINGARDFELEFHGDSGGMLVYVAQGGPTPTPPPVTPAPTPTTVGTPVTPFPLGTPAAWLPAVGRLIGR